MAKKIRNSREFAIDMIKMSLKYHLACADKDWVGGMVVAWSNKLIKACSTKKDAKANRKELSDDMKTMIHYYVYRLPNLESRKLFIESCHNFNLFPDTKTKERSK